VFGRCAAMALTAMALVRMIISSNTTNVFVFFTV